MKSCKRLGMHSISVCELDTKRGKLSWLLTMYPWGSQIPMKFESEQIYIIKDPNFYKENWLPVISSNLHCFELLRISNPTSLGVWDPCNNQSVWA